MARETNTLNPSLDIWRKNVLQYSDLLEQAMFMILQSERRDVATYFTKLLKHRDFQTFCNELHGKFHPILQRFISGESKTILERELFGSSFSDIQTDLTTESAIQALSKFYAQYLSSKLLSQDPFSTDEHGYRESLKAATSIASSHRLIEKPALGDALSAVEQDSALVYRTKFKTFNFLLGGGIRSRRLYTIGGAPGVGKSGFLLNMFLDACRNKTKAVYVSLENSIEETQRRILAHLAQYDLSMLYFDRPGTREDVLARLEEYKEVIEQINEYGTIIETSSTTLDEIRGTVQEHKPKLLCLDYLNLITHIVHRDLAKDLEDLTMGLARMSKEEHLATITACQLNRGAIQAEDPDESHVGESFGIVKASDMFCTLYPYRQKETDSGAELQDANAQQMVFKIAKSRFTGLSQIPLKVKKNIIQFEEL